MNAFHDLYLTRLHNHAIGAALVLPVLVGFVAWKAATDKGFRYAVRATVLWLVGR